MWAGIRLVPRLCGCRKKVLFTGDLIFEGRYPFLATADVEKLMQALRWLPALGARIIVPGHGLLCGDEEIRCQLEYTEKTWKRTAEHIQLGYSLDQAITDPGYPRYSGLGYKKLHSWNIKVCYRKLKKITA